LQGPYQVLLLFVPTALRSRWLLLLKIEISSIVFLSADLYRLCILNGEQSEQKVTTLDKDLARNISAKYGSNPSSGS
jgi:hypothetical protein